jgi:hypothetical protein
LWLPELHRELPRQVAKETENADKRNEIGRNKENRRAINDSRDPLKEERQSDFMNITADNLKTSDG